MKKEKKIAFLLATVLGIVSMGMPVNQIKTYAKEESINKNDNVKLTISNEFLSKLDEFVIVKNNSFKLIENEKLKEVVKEYANKNNFSYEELLIVIRNMITETNVDIKTNHKIIDEEKTIIDTEIKATFWDDTGHEVIQKWWGARHIFNNGTQVRRYAYKISTSSTSAYALAALFSIPVPPAAVIEGLIGSYLGQMSADLRNYWEEHESPFYFDVSRVLYYSFTIQ
ncbi:hypothetical protein [Parvimonas parva]|uniref:Uncharacterized protein n=1 Tax=Parvimonas parva TaxID=2769485 RepID=A0ABS1CAX1_9FIRM|nr:hypothetical protein [Parvimonas parva]MBK1469271.1 hypothetical protein [Parvimonas parva]CRH60190.1 Uncharacterised protein [Chlamydia trachomatis]